MKFPPWGVGLTSNQRVTGYPVTTVCLLYHWAHLPWSAAFSMGPAPRLFGQTQKPHPCMASSSQLKSLLPNRVTNKSINLWTKKQSSEQLYALPKANGQAKL